MIISAPRIGCVPYLNARPLVEGIGYPVTEMVPARLWDFFSEGKFDVALLSSSDVLALPAASVVDGISISCRGPVRSVLLAYTGELKALRSVQLDPSSHTSNFLAQIVLGELRGLQLEYVQITDRVSIDLPAVMIGDPALDLSKRSSNAGMKFLDLGEEWFRQTGLPFVFALWAFGKDFTEKDSLSKMLRESKEQGLANLPWIASKTSDPEFTMAYLGGAIRYDLGEKEKRGLKLFGEYLTKMKLLDRIVSEITYH